MKIKQTVRAMFGLVMVSALLFSTQVSAQEVQSSGLQVAPTRSELVIDKGTSKTFSVTVTNVTAGTVIVKTAVDDFEPNTDGSPKIYPESDEVRPFSVKPFLSSIPDFTLTPGQKEAVTVSATIPDDQAAGAYYGVLRFQAVPAVEGESSGGGQVALTASIGHLVLIQVPGDLTENMTIESLKAARNDKTNTFFAQSPDEAFLTVKNTGNAFIKPFGAVVVKKGSKEVFTYNINEQEPKANVIPGSSRTFKNKLENVGGFGKYTLVASVAYTQGGETLNFESSFWVIPLWLAAVAGAVTIGIIVLIIFVVRKFRKRK